MMELKAKAWVPFNEENNGPENLRHCSQIIHGWLRTWDEYVPASYDGTRSVPLVLSVHGGALHNAHTYTAWHLVAERENLIIAYPHSLIEGIKFNVWDSYTEEERMPDDVAYLDALITILQKKYRIDPERIYMQGQSVGDNMVSTYAYQHGCRLAAAAPLSGPASPSIFVSEETGAIVRKPQQPLPIIRTHGSEDIHQPLGRLGKIWTRPAKKMPDEKPVITEEQRKNKWLLGQMLPLKMWTEVNSCSKWPQISIKGKYNWVVYEGEPCDCIYYVVEGGQHRPYFDMADLIWSAFFSRYRRKNGQIVKTSAAGQSGWRDHQAVALAEGSSYAYVDNQKVAIDEAGHGCKLLEDEWYTPAAFLEHALPGEVCCIQKEDCTAKIIWKGHQIQFAAGHRVMILDGHLVSIPAVRYMEGCLYVPISYLMELLCGYQKIMEYQVCYFNHAGGVMTYDLSRIIRELLEVDRPVCPAECLELERKLQDSDDKTYAVNCAGEDQNVHTPEQIFDNYFAQYREAVETFKANSLKSNFSY